MFRDAEMKMPRSQIDGQVSIGNADLGCSFEDDLENGALDTRSDYNVRASCGQTIRPPVFS